MQDCLTPWHIVINQIYINPPCVGIYRSVLPEGGTTLHDYFPVFLMTYLLEIPFYAFCLRNSFSFLRILIINFILNIATHPIIYIFMPIFLNRWHLNYPQYLMIAETFAPIVEAILLRYIFQMGWKAAIWTSIAANLFSWSVGVYWNT